MSSVWALEDRIILGLGEGGKGFGNLQRHDECVVNVPDSSCWKKVELLAPFTGADPVPVYKQGLFRFEKDKFSIAKFTPISSELVKPFRVNECPLQIEARICHIHITGDTRRFGIIEVKSLLVHAHERIIESESRINPCKWSPLIYNFRHYFGLGEELGKTFRAET